MAFFASEGIARPYVTGAARSGTHVAGARVAGGSYGSGSTLTESKAPYIPSGSLIDSRAGDGQRFPFTARVLEDKRLRIAGTIEGQPDASVLIATFTTEAAFRLDLTASRAIAGSATASKTSFTLRRNGAQFATMTFAAGATAATFAASSTTTFEVGDTLTMLAPGAQDVTLADIVFTLMGIVD